jgi:hypothetical protein
MSLSLFDRPDILPGLAVDQPYAGLVRLLIKDLETRMFRVHKRGAFVVCATNKVRHAELRALRAKLVPSRVSADDFDAATALLGCVVAQANIVGCRLLVKADEPRSCFWSDADAGRRYAWELADIRPLVPRSVRCMPGFFPVDLANIQQVAA